MAIHKDDHDVFDPDFPFDEDEQDADSSDKLQDFDLDLILAEVDADVDPDSEAGRFHLDELDLNDERLPGMEKRSAPSRSADAFGEWLKNDTRRMQQVLKKMGYDSGRMGRIRDEAMRKAQSEVEEKRSKLKAAYKEFREAVGRGGMREGDHLDSTFTPYPVQFWTDKELKNRLRWLKKQRAELLGKPEKIRELARNAEKIRRYTRELFRRCSKEGMEQSRKEFNRLRRSRRRIAKQRKIAALMKSWKEKKRAERAAYKALINQHEPKP